MNVGCPQCTSVFRVDPAKVPPGGVRARCSVCSGVINVPEPSFEEPVASGAPAAWPERGGSEWGRIRTPEGGWTSPAPTAEPTPPRPVAARPTPPTPAPPDTPPSEVPAYTAMWQTPPATATPGWGDWPAQSSPFGENPATAPPAQPPVSDPWGGFTGNPLAPEVATPPYSSPAPVQSSYAAPVQEPPAPPASVEPPPLEPTPIIEPEPHVEGYEAVTEAASQPHAIPAERAAQTSPPAQAAAQGGEATHVNPFLRRDPHERARRLARALASDIVVYYPDKHADGLRDGNLREVFREEIKKSYDDYVAHVGAELAQSTTYFQDALNEVLAGGRRLF